VELFIISSYILSATLSFALRDLGFSPISFSEGQTGLLVIIFTVLVFPHTQIGMLLGQIHSVAQSLNLFLTILSSSE